MAGPSLSNTTIDILDSSLTRITSIRSPMPLSADSILQYSKELSDFGQCKFRISSYDPIFANFGDILQPHQNHIRIYRGGQLVWSGAIIENTKRTKDFVEVVGAEYEWYLNRILIVRSGLDPLGTAPSPIGTFNTSPTSTVVSGGTSVTMTFNQVIPYSVSMGQSINLAGFGGNNINGRWVVTSFTSNTVTVATTGPTTYSSAGTVTFSDNLYRIFDNGTMGAQITSIMNETVTIMKGVSGNHPLAAMTLGAINTPNYPPNTTNAASPPVALSGPYTFGNGVTAPQMTFDFHTVLYVLKSMANVSYADFGIDENLVFNFLSFFGKDNHYDVNFTWGQHGNAIDFNVPRLGQQQCNDLLGIATDINGNVLHFEQSDQASVTTSGLLQQVAGYADVKDQATLNARIQAELPLVSNPEESPITFTLDERGYPSGFYDIGDIVTCNVNHDALTYSAVKRIVGITVSVNNQGREFTTVQLNTPLPGQFGSTGSTQ